jgi:hypothetical protein
MLFNVASCHGVSQAYVMFTVSQYDSYSYCSTSRRSSRSIRPSSRTTSRAGHTHRHQRHDPAGRPGVHTAEHDRDRRELHGAGRGAVQHRYGDRPGERAADGPVLPDLRPARQPDYRRRRRPIRRRRRPLSRPVSDIGVRTFAQVNSTLSELTGVPTTNTAVDATYLSVQQQLPHIPTLEAFFLGQPGRRRAARGPILQHDGQYAVAGGAGLPGRDLQRLDCSRRRPASIASPARSPRGDRQRPASASQPAASTVTTELGNLIGSCATAVHRATTPARVIGRDGRGLRRGVRQCRNDDRLIKHQTNRRGFSYAQDKERSGIARAAAPSGSPACRDAAAIHRAELHDRRRTVLLPSIFSLIANPRMARAQLAPTSRPRSPRAASRGLGQ